jgi:hypothetical protein
MQSNPEDYVKYLKLNNTIISDQQKELFTLGYFARIPYCNEPNFIGYALLVVYLFIKAIVDFFVLIISIFDDDTTIEGFGNYMLGCARYHFAFNAGKTFSYYSNFAGISWSSSILDTNHKDLHVMDAYGHEGYRRAKLNPASPPNYIINYTVPQILAELSNVFNADFRIINGTLYFERVDWFAQNAVQIQGEATDSYCVESLSERLVTNLDFNYTTDMLDETSQQVNSTYGRRKDLNPSEYTALKGTRSIGPRIAMSRFVSDRWGDEYIMKKRQSPFIGSPIFHDLILSRGQTTELRILELPPVAGNYRYPTNRAFKPGPFVYQERYIFDDYEGDPGFKVEDTLWNNFWFIEDPEAYPRYFSPEIKIQAKDACQTLELIETRSLNVYFLTPYGKAIPEEIEYDTDSGIFMFKNCTIWP